MEDITPGLLEKIQKQFYHDIEKSSIIKNFKKQAQRGKTSYSQANEVAQEIGKILAQSYSDNLSSDILPDGKMYYNIASRVLDPTLRGAYEMVADNAAIVQQIVNEAAGIGIKTIRAQIQQDNIDGIVNRISSEEYFDDVKWILDAPVRNLVQKAMDDVEKYFAQKQELTKSTEQTVGDKSVQKENDSQPKSRKESVLQALRERQVKIKEQEQNAAKEKSRTHKKGEVSL